ncbi:hypothetical protein Plhal304r1_c055g0140991 [Plasmopara halstedii]
MVIVFLDVTPFGQLSATAIPTRLLARSCTVNKPSINTSPSSVKLPSEIPNTRHVASPNLWTIRLVAKYISRNCDRHLLRLVTIYCK